MDGFSLVGLLLFVAYLVFLFKGNSSLEDGKKKSKKKELQQVVGQVGVWAEAPKDDEQEDSTKSHESALQLVADELAEAARGGEAALDACFKRLLKRYPNEMLIEALDLGANQLFEKEKKWDKLIKDLEKNEAKGK